MMKYKYGVEYETNGEKPDLPDDVLVDIYEENRWITSDGDIAVGDWNWSAVEKFRIVDERYKPKEQDMNDWYEKGELPPVGVECQFTVDVSKLPSDARAYIEFANNEPYRPVTCKVTHYGKSHFLYESQGQEYSMITAHVEFRPLRTERDVLVEKAEMDIHRKYIDMVSRHHIHALIDAGWRPVKQQSEDEFVDQSGLDDDSGRILYRAGCRFIEQVKV